MAIVGGGGKSSDFGKMVLPIPTPEYSAARARQTNQRIEQLLGDALGRYELPQYAGIPHAALTGTDAAWSAPGSNVITVIPFNTIFIHHGNLIVGNNLQTIFVMNVGLFLILPLVAAPGGSSSVKLIFYANGVEVYSASRTVSLNSGESYSIFMLGKAVPSGAVLTVGLSHSSNTALTIDLTRARWWLLQLTPDPRLEVVRP